MGGKHRLDCIVFDLSYFVKDVFQGLRFNIELSNFVKDVFQGFEV